MAARKSRKLSGSQIREKFTGMQLTDEVIGAMSTAATARSELRERKGAELANGPSLRTSSVFISMIWTMVVTKCGFRAAAWR